MYYAECKLKLMEIPYEHMKYLDEAHIVHKDLASSSVIAEKGEPVFVVENVDLDYRLSLTIMTTLSDPERTVVCQLRDASNTAMDFLKVI